MTALFRRRSVLTAAGAAAALVAVGGAAEWRTLLPGDQSPEAEATDFVRLLADVHADYVNGRVTEHEGWVLSQHEFDTIGQRQAERAEDAPASSVS